MGTKPNRLDTPRTGLEDQIAGIFGNALSAASAPRPAAGAKGSAPAPSVGMRAAGTMANASAPFGQSGDPRQTGGQTGGQAPGGFGQPGSQQFGGGLPPGGLPQLLGGTVNPTIQDIFTSLSLPQYGGPLTAGNNPLMGSALDVARGGLDALPGYSNLGSSITQNLQSFGGRPSAPSAVTNLLTNRPGTGVLNQLAGGGGAAGELMRLGQGGGAVGQLLAQGGQSDQDFGGILDALNAARRGSLEDSLRDTQERFSASGLRFSTDLANSLGETSRRSDEQFLGLGAQLLPQLTQQRQNALSTAGQLQLGSFGQAGQLGLGAGDVLQRGGLAAGDILGNLYQGQQGRELSALQSLPGAAQLFASLPGQLAQQAFGLGSAQQGLDTQALQARYNEFLRTQGGLLAPILNFASGAPQITGPGKGSQLMNAGTQLGAGALGFLGG